MYSVRLHFRLLPIDGGTGRQGPSDLLLVLSLCVQISEAQRALLLCSQITKLKFLSDSHDRYFSTYLMQCNPTIYCFLCFILICPNPTHAGEN